MPGKLRFLRQIQENSFEYGKIRLVLYHRPLREEIPAEIESGGLIHAYIEALLRVPWDGMQEFIVWGDHPDEIASPPRCRTDDYVHSPAIQSIEGQLEETRGERGSIGAQTDHGVVGLRQRPKRTGKLGLGVLSSLCDVTAGIRDCLPEERDCSGGSAGENETRIRDAEPFLSRVEDKALVQFRRRFVVKRRNEPLLHLPGYGSLDHHRERSSVRQATAINN